VGFLETMTIQTGLGVKELLQDKRDEILAIAEKHGAYNVRVFGSVARGEATAESDVDFLIDYDLKKISPWFPAGLMLDLEKLLNRKVDVVSENSLHYFLKDRILQEAISL
jgi:predicted nucleotidyltransferase